MPVTVDLAKCNGTAECLKACAFNALDVIDGKCVIYENCTDCDACVRSCPVDAIVSSTVPAAGKTRILIVDFAEQSAIAAVAERIARKSGAGSTALRADAADAGAAADTVAETAARERATLVVLPHDSSGTAIAARAAAKLGSTLIAGCSDLSIDESGAVRAPPALSRLRGNDEPRSGGCHRRDPYPARRYAFRRCAEFRKRGHTRLARPSIRGQSPGTPFLR